MEVLPVESDSLGNYRADGALVNVVTGMGTGTKDKGVYTRVGNRTLLTQAELELLYLVGIPRRFVDAIPEEMFRHLPSIKIGGDEDTKAQDKITAFEENLKELKLHATIAEAITLQRLYGGACVIALVDDGLDPSEPLDLKRIRNIEGFVALSRHECIPEDVNILDYSKPRSYRVSTSQRLSDDQESPTTDIIIHSSRVARFDGLYLPWNIRSRNTGWGMSCIQLVWDAYVRYESSLSGLDNMIQDSDMFVHKMPGLFKRLAAGAGGEDAIRRRLEANVMSRSNYGGMAIDGEEEVSWLSRALGNLSQAITPFVDDLQAATGWPSSILMGSSPGGLGKEGRFEERTWASLVERWQEVYCRGPVTELYTMLMHSRTSSFKGRPPEKWEVFFPSIFTQTEEEKVTLQQQLSTVDQTYVNIGVLDALEVRESRFGGSEYNTEITLMPDVSEQFKEKQKLNHDVQLQSLDAQMQMTQQQLAGGGMPPEGGQPPGASGQPPEGGPDIAPPSPDVPMPKSSGEALVGDKGGPMMSKDPAEESKLLDAVLAADKGADTTKTEEPPESVPDPKTRRKTFDAYEAKGLRIEVTNEIGDIRAGRLIGPDGQRIDNSDSQYLVLGPDRTNNYKLYQAQFKRDSQLVPGPYVTGFRTISLAAHAVSKMYPRVQLGGLTEVSPAALQSLRAGWGAY